MARRQEQGEQEGQDQEPLGDGDVDGEPPGEGPEHEAEGQGQNVHDHHVLEAEGVAEVQAEIGRGAKSEPSVQPEGERQGADHEGDRSEGGGADRQFAGGEGAQFLLRMEPILLDVRDIVPQIHRAGEAAEGHEGEEGAQEGLGLEQVLREEERCEDEKILRPLVRPQRAEECSHEGAITLAQETEKPAAVPRVLQ